MILMVSERWDVKKSVSRVLDRHREEKRVWLSNLLKQIKREEQNAVSSADELPTPETKG